MQNSLKKLRQTGDSFNKHKQLIKAGQKKIEPLEGLKSLQALYENFIPQLEETEALFRTYRETFLTEFQNRLLKIANISKTYP